MAQSTTNDFMLSTQDLADFVGLESKKCLQELETLVGKLPYKSLVPAPLVRRYLTHKGYSFPQQVISFQMLKGGVAKTTSCLNFGLRAAMYGASVLFIDLDQQANLSFALGIEDESLPVWVDIIEKKTKVDQARVSIDVNIDLIPSSLNNSVLDRVLLNGSRNWSQSVRTPLQSIKDQYDLILIDTAPNLSAINTAATCASDVVVLPINPDKFSLSGLRKHLADLEDLKKEFELDFKEKILFTKFDARESSSKQILNQVAEDFSEQLLEHYIRTSADIKNSIGASKTIFSTKSNAKEDYDLVTQELLGFLEK
jgi:chromosome partitioning protein